MMGVQNSEHFRDRRGRQGLPPARPAQLAAHLQQPEPPRHRQHGPRGRRRQRLRRRDHRGDERGRHAGRRLALRRPDDARCDRDLEAADRDHALELPRAQQSPAAQDRRGDPRSSPPRAASWASPACAISSRDREPTTIEHIVDHIDHVVKLVGIEHVGIGSDSDLNGYDDMPADQRKELHGIVQVELRLPRQARHRRLRPSEEDFRPDRGTDPPRLQRLEHRGCAGRQFPAAPGHRVGPGAGYDQKRGRAS